MNFLSNYYLQDKYLIIETNQSSPIRYPISNLRSTQKKKFFISTKRLKTVENKLKNLIFMSKEGWYIELQLKGIGFKTFRYKSKITLDLGLSVLFTYKEANDFKVNLFKDKLIIFSYNKNSLYTLAHRLKNLYKTDPYKGKGIQFNNQIIKLKGNKVK